jgi:hypothetical protein
MAKKLLNDIQIFDKDYKKGYRGIKLENDYEYLKPPRGLKKKSSTRSVASSKS